MAPGVLSLVVRAGGGSVRDSLSVLDQLMAGAGAAGLDYELAVSLEHQCGAATVDRHVRAGEVEGRDQAVGEGEVFHAHHVCGDLFRPQLAGGWPRRLRRERQPPTCPGPTGPRGWRPSRGSR